ncbi:hypothetical protein TREMEDRAFT_59121 [Tremella mesenterica DSM 1558]|uniref:uncharacterized protein n=1 Tax=Tremella mesenterica (strain ATCC 24925 / CBS 8224 / DSM 1558 / NBRC 9311 / NRRL Y-6157 / RJB 2259-6 / UBC 559-6) TaxID=578456 RepID=UPI0003F49025|nr:uncharacterized protein TREMEDRAFT_59121 [Tremella mesenterica DSM 1558]EIW72963.1 hypothetical protein TREMEDRAFT_59121 [Tremella mesenterica DSM 1558]
MENRKESHSRSVTVLTEFIPISVILSNCFRSTDILWSSSRTIPVKLTYCTSQLKPGISQTTQHNMEEDSVPDPWADVPSVPHPDLPIADPSSQKSSPQTKPLPLSITPFPIDDTTSDPLSSPLDTSENQDEDDGFDEFDQAGPNVENGDDGFGDFGDFEQGDDGEMNMVNEPEDIWSPLKLKPLPTIEEITKQVSRILKPLIPDEEGLTDEPLRMIGGLGQIMSSSSTRDIYAQLTTPPMLKPLDWTRSRVRREHLISMGVPVNLDEVDSHRLSSLPPLRITTNPNLHTIPSNGNGNGNGNYKGKNRESRDVSPLGNGRPGSTTTPFTTGRDGHGFGQRPEMDMIRAEKLCGIEEDALSIMSLSNLKNLQNELVNITSQASSTLAWLLQLRDSQIQDSAT